MRAPRNYAAALEARQAKLKERLAKEEAKLKDLREQQMRQVLDFVKRAGVEGDPHALMGAMLKVADDLKDATLAEEYRRSGEAYFLRKRRAKPAVVEHLDAEASPIAGAA